MSVTIYYDTISTCPTPTRGARLAIVCLGRPELHVAPCPPPSIPKTQKGRMVSPHPTAIAAAFISTGIISLAPNVLLFLFPNYGVSGGSDGGRSILSLGQALAVGGLLGDVFIHTLPDCFADSFHGEQEHNHSHSHSNIGLRILLGFTIFLILDIFVRSIEDVGAGGNAHGCHSR